MYELDMKLKIVFGPLKKKKHHTFLWKVICSKESPETERVIIIFTTADVCMNKQLKRKIVFAPLKKRNITQQSCWQLHVRGWKET